MPRPPKEPSVLRSLTRVTGRTANLERRYIPAAASGGQTFATVTQADVSFPSGAWPLGAGGFTYSDMVNGNFWTTDATIFSIISYTSADPNASNPTFHGLRITAVGTYLFSWGIQCVDGGAVGTPTTVPVSADQNVAAHTDTSGYLAGSNVIRGLPQNGGNNVWPVTFQEIWAVTADTGAAGFPVVCSMAQASTHTLTAYTNLLVTQLSTSTLGI